MRKSLTKLPSCELPISWLRRNRFDLNALNAFIDSVYRILDAHPQWRIRHSIKPILTRESRTGYVPINPLTARKNLIHSLHTCLPALRKGRARVSQTFGSTTSFGFKPGQPSVGNKLLASLIFLVFAQLNNRNFLM